MDDCSVITLFINYNSELETLETISYSINVMIIAVTIR